MNCGLTIAEREALRMRLAELPETMPPRKVWHRIERQARAERLFAAPLSAGLQWVAGAGLAAGVVIAILVLPVDRVDQVATATTDRTEFPTVPDYTPASELSRFGEINALMARSQLLEEDLRSLPGEPSVMRAGTTATIAELQDRIAAIDLRLNAPGAEMTPEEREACWRERVRLMDSLVRLRYAQIQRVAF